MLLFLIGNKGKDLFFLRSILKNRIGIFESQIAGGRLHFIVSNTRIPEGPRLPLNPQPTPLFPSKCSKQTARPPKTLLTTSCWSYLLTEAVRRLQSVQSCQCGRSYIGLLESNPIKIDLALCSLVGQSSNLVMAM